MSKLKDKAVIFFDADDYFKIIIDWRQHGDSIVFTNGCFDILHAGHIEYLEAAAKLGDRLIVGLNDDASVSKLKGSNRPINNSVDRSCLLSSLCMVDMVIVFNGDTPLHLIKHIDPDYLVKGGDYKLEDIVGADYVHSRGNKVLVMPEKKGYSSTKIIESLS